MLIDNRLLTLSKNSPEICILSHLVILTGNQREPLWSSRWFIQKGRWASWSVLKATTLGEKGSPRLRDHGVAGRPLGRSQSRTLHPIFKWVPKSTQKFPTPSRKGTMGLTGWKSPFLFQCWSNTCFLVCKIVLGFSCLECFHYGIDRHTHTHAYSYMCTHVYVITLVYWV